LKLAASRGSKDLGGSMSKSNLVEAVSTYVITMSRYAQFTEEKSKVEVLSIKSSKNLSGFRYFLFMKQDAA